MKLKTFAQKELEKITDQNSITSSICYFIFIIGLLGVVAGIIVFLMGFSNLDKSIYSAERIEAQSQMYIGAGAFISGLLFLLLSSIGKALNELRNYTVVSFNLKYQDKNDTQTSHEQKDVQDETNNIKLDSLKIDDVVVDKKTKAEMKVTEIDGRTIYCYAGFIGGTKKFDITEIEKKDK